MLKSELIARLSARLTHLSAPHIADRTRLLIDTLCDALLNGNRIEIRDFGSFTLRYHAPRRAHDPRLHQYITTRAKYRPHFKPGKKLREAVKNTTPKSA